MILLGPENDHSEIIKDFVLSEFMNNTHAMTHF